MVTQTVDAIKVEVKKAPKKAKAAVKARKPKAKKKATKKQKSVPRSERTSVPCCLNFPRKLLNKLDKKAKKNGFSRAGAVNMLVERWVK